METLRKAAAGMAILCLISASAAASTAAWWRFEEATSGDVAASQSVGGSVTNTVLDGSGNANHMQTWIWYTAPTYNSSVYPTNSAVGIVRQTADKNLSSLYFSGANDDIYTSGKPINTKQFSAWTIEASFRLDVLNRWQVVVAKDGNPVGGQPPVSIKIRSNNVVEVGMVDGSGVARSLVGTLSISANKWYHVAATASSSSLSMWIKPEGASDYQSQGSISISGAFYNSYAQLNNSWVIGRGMWNGTQTDRLTGRIDEVRISDTVLTSSQFLGNTPYTDADNDGLPDSWEIANGLSTDATTGATGANGADGDPDGDGFSNFEEWRAGGLPTVSAPIAGGLKREMWYELTGDTLTSLTTKDAFYQKPRLSEFNFGSESPANASDNYGQRLRGYMTIPTTGTYRFYVSGDNEVELRVSEDGTPFSKKLAAWIYGGFSNFEEWTKYSTQKTAEYNFQQGQIVYVELLHKEGTYGDHVELGWSLNNSTPVKIPSSNLLAYAIRSDDHDDDGLLDSWEQKFGFDLTDNGLLHPNQRPDADPDGDGFTNFMEMQTDANPYAEGGNKGYVRRDIWTGLTGYFLRDLTNSAAYPKLANDSSIVSTALNFGSYGDNYGQRVQGLITPPRSGKWRFWIASDDASELNLSSTASNLDKARACYLDYNVVAGNFDTYPSQASEAKTLTAGTPYYFEILHKEGDFSDHLSLAWSYESVNWALASNGSTATQSSTYANDCEASMAIDGNTAPTSFSHTHGYADSWWQVDFGQNRNINRVVLINRDYMQQRLSNFHISVLDATGNELVGQDYYLGSDNVGDKLIWDLPQLVNARFIKIQILGLNNAGDGCLTLAEVQACEWYAECERKIITSDYLRSPVVDPLDLDEDSLPDAWENSVGLDANDNGSVNLLNGEYGDPDGDLISNREEYVRGFDPHHPDSAPGRFLNEIWNNISAYSVGELISNPRFYAAPDSIGLSEPSGLKFSGQYFGTRTRGYIKPTQTGDYTFWISARTSAELWLSTDDQKGKYAKKRIAVLDSGLGSGDGIASSDSNLWDRFSSQRSAPVHLEAGKSYYLEIDHQHGHTTGSHTSVAWALGDGDREVLPGSVVSSYLKTTDDADDDYLPDSWESQYGLNPTDNGASDPIREGERGDFDGDGLTNREEYLLGTNPASADTDGDGVSDYDEVNTYKTSPTVSNSLTGATVVDVPLTSYNQTGTTSAWQVFDGGLLGSSFRGKIEWSFTVPSDGWWLLELAGRLRGTLRPSEEMTFGLKIDGKSLADQKLQFLNSQPAGMNILTPFLTAGTHTFSLDIKNDIGRRTFQIQSLKVSGPGGFDGDNNGRPDWLDAILNQGNVLAPVPTESPVSPLFIEGSVRYLGNGVQAEVGGQPLALSRGLGDLHWFANAPLNTMGNTAIAVHFENADASATVSWTRWNVIAQQALTVRVGDSVKIGAWTSAEDTESLEIGVDGQTSSITAANFIIKTFTQPGTYAVTANRAGSQTTSTITVVSANFGAVAPFYADAVTWRSFPQVAANLKLVAEPSLTIDYAVPEGSGQKAEFRAVRSGDHVIAARIGNGTGPIVALAVVPTVGVSDALKNDAAVYIGSTPDGYRIIRTPIVVADLPPGGYVVLTIFRAGVTFLDGTTVMTLHEEDFVNGVAYVDFRYPADMSGGYCHYIDVYDAQGNNLGRR